MLRGILIRAIVVVWLPVAFFWPFGGVLFYLWYSHGRPNDFVYPQYYFDNGAYLIAVTTLAGYVLFELRKSPPPLLRLWLVGLFWLWIALSTIFASDPSLAEPKLWQYTSILIISFLVSAVANSEDRVRAMLEVIAASIGFLGAKGAFDFVITGGQTRLHGVGGLMKEQNEFALALNMAIPLLIELSYAHSRPVRILYRVMAVGCAISVIATYSRSGLLGLGLATLLVIWYSKRRVLGYASLGVAVVLLLPFVPSKAIARYKTIPTAAEVDPSAIGRLEAWETGLKMIKAHPFFGVGPLNFLTQFHNYSPQYHARVAHNAFVSVASESGLPCAVLFVAVIGSTIFSMWRMRRGLRRYPGTEKLASYCLCIQMAMTVYIVPNFFISRQNQDLMYHLVGMSAGLALLASQRIAELEPEPSPSRAMLLNVQPASA